MKVLHLVGFIDIENAEAGDGAKGGDGGELAMAAMKVDEFANVYVADAVAISDHKAVFLLEIALDPLDSAAGHGVGTRFGERDIEILFLVIVLEIDLGLFAEANGEIIVHCLVIQEVFLDHVPAVAQTQDEVAEAVMRVQLHDMPEDGAATDVNERFGAKLRFFAHTGA